MPKFPLSEGIALRGLMLSPLLNIKEGHRSKNVTIREGN
jgi:hypothetical protein